ncbi:hypothetical protein [Burkholderia sp. 22313]|uniref:hypothetical protein n=1 Tax=Burkholderia sp. 22313 TaxID=3453908 RepID=UPI003F832E2C
MNIFNACKSILAPCFLLANDGLAGNLGLLAEQAQTRRPGARAFACCRRVIGSEGRLAGCRKNESQTRAASPRRRAQHNRIGRPLRRRQSMPVGIGRMCRMPSRSGRPLADATTRSVEKVLIINLDVEMILRQHDSESHKQ